MNSLRDAALEWCLKRGFSIFPCKEKKPLTRNGFKDASKDPAQIKKWFAEYPQAQIGAPTGEVNHLLVVDVDGPQGEEWVRKQNWPQTFTVQTSPGHCQYWFRQPPGITTKCSAGVIAPEVDIRGDGGYVILPPSTHHETKQAYSPLSWDIPRADAPHSLVRFATATAISPPRSIEGDAIPQRKRHQTLLSFAGSLRARGLTTGSILADLHILNEQHARPPLADEELREIAKFVGSKPVGFPNQRIIETSAEQKAHAPEEVTLRDLPATALDGRLGEICQTRLGHFPLAYSWPAVLAVASALCSEREPGVHMNLFVALVGPVHSGKSQAINYATQALGLERPTLMDCAAGSAEALIRETAGAAGNPRLFSPDELGHTLEKMKIEHSSFSFVLNTAFYKSNFPVLMGKKERREFDCHLSILGGLRDESFQELFNAATVGGLYDRFLFGLCPGNFRCEYRPFEGPPEISRLRIVKIDPSIWKLKRDWEREYDFNPRISEIAIRCATICASFNGQPLLLPEHTDPHLELLRYQTRIREILRPNPGENFEARLAHKFLSYLARQNGRFVTRRELLRNTHAYDLGPSTADRALAVLIANGDVETVTTGRIKLLRLASENELPDGPDKGVA